MHLCEQISFNHKDHWNILRKHKIEAVKRKMSCIHYLVFWHRVLLLLHRTFHTIARACALYKVMHKIQDKLLPWKQGGEGAYLERMKTGVCTNHLLRFLCEEITVEVALTNCWFLLATCIFMKERNKQKADNKRESLTLFAFLFYERRWSVAYSWVSHREHWISLLLIWHAGECPYFWRNSFFLTCHASLVCGLCMNFGWSI